MRTYYLFQIKEETYQDLLGNEKELFLLLSKLKKLEQEQINYGISLFQQLCNLWPVEIVHHYLTHKFRVTKQKNHYIFNQRNQLIVKPSYFVLKTEYDIPSIFYNLRYSGSHIFVCDFYNTDYFYLNELLKNKKNLISTK